MISGEVAWTQVAVRHTDFAEWFDQARVPALQRGLVLLVRWLIVWWMDRR